MQHMSLHHTAKRLLFHKSECDQTSVREIRELRFEYCLKKDIKCFSNTGTFIYKYIYHYSHKWVFYSTLPFLKCGYQFDDLNLT